MNKKTVSPQRHNGGCRLQVAGYRDSSPTVLCCLGITSNEQRSKYYCDSYTIKCSAAPSLIKAARPFHYSLFITHCGAAKGGRCWWPGDDRLPLYVVRLVVSLTGRKVVNGYYFPRLSGRSPPVLGQLMDRVIPSGKGD